MRKPSPWQIEEDRIYLETENWRCGKNPSGAHHWVGDLFTLTCKYCGEEKDITVPRLVHNYPKSWR